MIGLRPQYLHQMIYADPKSGRRIPIGRLDQIADALGLKGELRSEFIIAASRHPGYQKRIKLHSLDSAA